VEIREKLVKVNSSNRGWQANLAYEKTVLGGLMQSATAGKDGALYSSAAVASLMSIGSAQDASTDVLDFATAAMLIVVPVQLRNPPWTVAQAERLVDLTHGRKPTFLLTLAQAYAQNGERDKAIMTANRGLALLPALPRKRLDRRARLDDPSPSLKQLVLAYLWCGSRPPFVERETPSQISLHSPGIPR
jgi:hypothetical protein